MQSPDYLKVGDSVGIIAPARFVRPEEIEAALQVFKGWGLKIVFGKHLFDVFHQFAGRDIDRIDDFQKMLDDPGIKAIFCARGGYGALRIIDSLCWDGLRKYPKWIVGYSDITLVHGHIQRQCNMKTIHAAMPYSFFHLKLSTGSTESLKKALFGEAITYQWQAHPLNRNGMVTAELAGGNLSILYAIIASPSEFDLENKILFIEDLDEYLYHIERMMLALRRSGRLSRLAGLVVGGMSDLKDNKVPMGFTAEEIIANVVAAFDYPVSFGFPAGHEEENLALVMGNSVDLIVNEKPRLVFNR